MKEYDTNLPLANQCWNIDELHVAREQLLIKLNTLVSSFDGVDLQTSLEEIIECITEIIVDCSPSVKTEAAFETVMTNLNYAATEYLIDEESDLKNILEHIGSTLTTFGMAFDQLLSEVASRRSVTPNRLQHY